MLTACSMPQVEIPRFWPFNQAQTTPTPAPRPVTVLGPIGSQDENAAIQSAIASFEAANPNWPVQGALALDYAAQLEQALLDGEPPDVFMAAANELASLVAKQIIAPVPAAYPVGDNVPPNLVDALAVDGTPYCYPRNVATLALFYNPALFDRAEIAYPANGWGWADLRAAADATTDANFDIYGMVVAPDISRIHPFLLQASTDPDVWEGADALQAIEYFLDFYHQGFAVTPVTLDSTWNGEAFGRGRAAMTIEGNWLIPYLAAEFPDLDYGVVELPAGPARRGSTAFVSCWVTSQTAENPDAAQALAAALSRAAQDAAIEEIMPLSLEQATSWVGSHPAYVPFVNALAYASPWQGHANFQYDVAAINRSIQQWIDDEATTPDVMALLPRLGVTSVTTDTLTDPLEALPTPTVPLSQ